MPAIMQIANFYIVLYESIYVRLIIRHTRVKMIQNNKNFSRKTIWRKIVVLVMKFTNQDSM